MTTTETGSITTTMSTDKAIVVSFSTSEGEMVTERVLTIGLDGPTLVTVECTADILLGDFEEKHKISSSSPAVTHNLHLNGLLADTTYSCRTDGAAQNATADFTTGTLPISLTDHFNSPTGTSPVGYMLFNTFAGGGDPFHWLVIQDYWGNIRWYVDGMDYLTGIIALEHEPDAGGIIAGGGRVNLFAPSVYNMSGVLIERFDDFSADHDIDYHNGSLYSPVTLTETSCVQRWSLDTLEQTWEWCVSKEDGYKVNSLAVTEDESAILITTYEPAEGVVKIDTKSGDTMWTFKPDGSGDFSVDQQVFDLNLQHDVSIVECDSSDHDICMLVYDNGSVARGYSQILNYGFNETKMEATLIRSFNEKGWFEDHSGGIQQMQNGAWLISMASITPDSQSSYLIVDTNNNELWRMASKNTSVGAYRARHIEPCDIFNHTGMCPE
jgi:hypothetical protein